jgi:hypothetical protein
MNFAHIKSAKNAKPTDDVHNIPTYGVNHPNMSTPMSFVDMALAM